MKENLIPALFTIALFSIGHCQAQDSTSNQVKIGDKNLSFLVGYNFWANHYLEVGLAINQLNFEDNKIEGRNIYISTEIRIARDLIFGPKIGFWVGTDAGGLGLSFIYYTDGDKSALRLRPEVGIGLSRFKLTYGYNLVLTNKEFNGINKSNIAINILLGLKTFKRKGK